MDVMVINPNNTEAVRLRPHAEFSRLVPIGYAVFLSEWQIQSAISEVLAIGERSPVAA